MILIVCEEILSPHKLLTNTSYDLKSIKKDCDMKKISVIVMGVILGVSLSHANSSEKESSMKCGGDMQMKDSGERPAMKQKNDMGMKEKSGSMTNGKCGAAHMEKSSGKCGDDK